MMVFKKSELLVLGGNSTYPISALILRSPHADLLYKVSYFYNNPTSSVTKEWAHPYLVFKNS